MVILRLPQVAGRTGKPPSSLRADVRSGLFVPPVKLGPRSSGWPQHEVDAINAARVAGKVDDEIRQLVRKLVALRKEAA